MKRLFLSGIIALLLASMPSIARAQSERLETTSLNNRDVSSMVEQKLESAEIVRIIKFSPCTFDTFPPVLREMRRRGVSDIVLQAMVEAPYGPSAERNSRDDLGDAPIYHYAEQLKQMGFLAPATGGTGLPSTRQRTRASRSRQRQ